MPSSRAADLTPPAPTPEHGELPVPRLPPAGKKFPCQKCGARLDFDPSARALKCPYCGFEEAIAASAEQVRERNWEAFWNKQGHEETILSGHSCQVTCQACNAVVLLEDKVVTTRCPYCGSHLENQPKTAQGMIAPEAVLPFAVSRREAVAAFNRWIAGLWFAPNDLRQFANLGQLSGVYVPYWTFDSMTYTYYAGQRGDNYTVTERDARGNTRTVVRTRWTWVSGEVRNFFDDVIVCASHSVSREFARDLEPWDLHEFEAFKPEYLSGFLAERYAIGLRAGFDEARQIMDWHIRALCCQDMGGDHQRLEEVKTQHVGVTFKHVLLPVWLAAYRYQDRPFQILVNARTGEVVGPRPYSVVKITLFVLAIIAAVLAVVLLFWGVSGGAEPGRRPGYGVVTSPERERGGSCPPALALGASQEVSEPLHRSPAFTRETPSHDCPLAA